MTSALAPRLAETEPPYDRGWQARRIKDLPLAGRPRERLLERGADALAESELLAILLGTGDARRSAVGLAEELLARFTHEGETTGIKGLAEAGADELVAVPGVGPAKAARLLAAFELARRLSTATVERPAVNGPADAYRLLAPRLAGLDREHFVALLLNSKHQLLAISAIAVGTLNATLVHPRELFKEAIRRSAAAMILAHNHPSGDPTPSPEDRALTCQLMAGAEILGIRILDHIVLGDGRYHSMRESTRLWVEHAYHQ